jgi:hypothetical protein
MPTLRPSTNYQPGGSATEFSGAGLELTGASVDVQPVRSVEPPDPVHLRRAAHLSLHAHAPVQQVRYLKHVDVTNIGGVHALAFTGIDGAATTRPSYLSGIENRRDYNAPPSTWGTTEATEPSSL